MFRYIIVVHIFISSQNFAQICEVLSALLESNQWNTNFYRVLWSLKGPNHVAQSELMTESIHVSHSVILHDVIPNRTPIQSMECFHSLSFICFPKTAWGLAVEDMCVVTPSTQTVGGGTRLALLCAASAEQIERSQRDHKINPFMPCILQENTKIVIELFSSRR